MIKINLLGGKKSDKPSGNARTMLANIGTSWTSSSEPGAATDIIIKLALLLVGPVGLYGYNTWVIGEKQSQLEFQRAEVARTQQELLRLTPEKLAIEKFEEDKKHLQNRINTIKTLSTQRLKSVKALDAIQSTIPTKAWLTKLELKEDKSETKVTFTGQALEDVVVSQFMQALSENIYFTNVALGSTEAKTLSDGAVVKAFVITSGLGKL